MNKAPAGATVLLAVASVDQLAVTLSQQGLFILGAAFKAYAHLGVAETGMLFSAIALGAAVGMLPAGLVLDRLGPKRVAWGSGAAILTTMLSLALWLPRNFGDLAFLLGLAGLFLPALSLTGNTAVTKAFDGSSREGLAIGIRQAATPLGGILAASLFPLLVKIWSLKVVLLIIALNAGGWAMGFAWTLKPFPADHPVPRIRTQGLRATISQLFPLRYPLLTSFLLGPGQYALLTYALLDLNERWHIPLELAGPIIAMALAGGFVARILMGRQMDRGTDAKKLIIRTALVGSSALAVWALLPASTPVTVIIVLFFALGAGLDGWNGLLTVWVTQASSTAQRGMALALIGMSAFLGIVLFMPLFGLLIRVSQSYRPIWGLLAFIYLTGTYFVWRSKKSDLATDAKASHNV